MKKLIVIAMVLAFCLVGSVQAQQQMDEPIRQFNVIVQLGTKKLVTVDTDQSRKYTLIYVKPLWWKKQTQAMKQDIVGGGMMLSRVQKRDVIIGVYVVDKVSLDYLAFGSLQSGEIIIYK